MIGGRLQISPPVDGVNLAVSSYRGDLSLFYSTAFFRNYTMPNDTLAGVYTYVGLSAEYIKDRIWLRGEYLFEA